MYTVTEIKSKAVSKIIIKKINIRTKQIFFQLNGIMVININKVFEAPNIKFESIYIIFI